tara:strand:- start:9389 stop:10162 length:774 start_codon:yes stop_codon:yes gene_type:complete
MSQDSLLIKKSNGVVTITFNRPEARNAMTGEIRAQLYDMLRPLNEDPEVRVLVLRGKGSFVAGGDVNAFAQTLELTPEQRRDNFVTRVNAVSPFVTLLANFSKPVISVVEGDVAGAGISIALASDFVIANKSARFTFAHAHVGLALDVGLSYFLPRIVGTLEAKKLAMLGGQLNADEAKHLGLITYLSEDDEVEEELGSLLKKLSRMSVPALAAIKQELAAAMQSDLAAQLALEAQQVGSCAATQEFEQRVAAFVNK